MLVACGGNTTNTTPTPVPSAPNESPIVNLTITPKAGTAPLAVTASTSGSTDPDGTIVSTSIDFGDGTVVNSASTQHTYSQAGSFTVTAKITDNQGVASATTMTVVVWDEAWLAPIGIPRPSFGVTETAPAPPNPWNSSTPGFFYVDTTGNYGACDDRNPNGFPSAGGARCTVPVTLGPGSYVEVHGAQPYSLSFSWNGTADAWLPNTSGPVWVRGQDYASRPKITGSWQTNSSAYIIMENLNFAAASSTSTAFGVGFRDGAANHHLAVRNSEVAGGNTDNSITSNGAAFGIGDWGYNSGPNTVHDVVIDNVNVHDLGPATPVGDTDWHGVAINGQASNIWITRSSFVRCSGDSIQIEAQNGYKARIHHIYFGRNTSSNNRQSGGWVKNAQDVIFSQNSADTFAPNTGGPGACYGAQYDHDYLWFLFNTCHNSPIGIDLASDSGSADNVYMIGNLMWHITANTFQPYNTGAFVIRSNRNNYVVNNTVYDYVGGLSMPPGAGNIVIQNNIFQHRNASGGYEWYTESSGTSLTLANNLFYNNGAAPNATTPWSGCVNCLNQDPLFVNPAATDLHLQTSPVPSPAVDHGTASSVYDTFVNRYGLSISYDADGKPRPQGAGWDMGAYERK